MCMGFPFRIMKMFWSWKEVMITQQCECAECHFVDKIKAEGIQKNMSVGQDGFNCFSPLKLTS